ncbi:hypothetical protein NDU88_000273 [Pleurodeles waltl]|uniref:Uncharacterized protein n=1 Tax=Pleurodeles waltl TaxID=8319 RepID=A0AAV7TEH2_PLEWA|nr:hypothetical protein NDU88_000273 [Pleurodeles waltl]
MGKRKPIDPLDPLSDRKKLKKQPLKLVTETKESTRKPFEEIDQLFEEVEAILNCTVGNNGASPPKNASAYPGRIQDFFKKRMKDQVPNPVLINSRVVSPITHTNTPSPLNGLTTTASDPLSRHGSHQVEEEGSTPTPVIPLSPVVKVIPNIVCRNRFEVLVEEDEIPRALEPPTADRNKENTPVPSFPSLLLLW